MGKIEMSDRDRTVSEASRAVTGGSISNPFRMGNSTTIPAGSLVSVEQQRAIAEVQARMIIARANPRDPIRCMDLILQDCTRPSLAQGALYQYARGGTAISGPSIRLAESMARRWGNIASGIKEISRDDGYSECVAYAWDLETGYYDERQFQIRHWRDTKGGGYRLTDERDIYELIANMGQRRKRAVLLTIIPGDVTEAATDQCEQTLNASADTSPAALKKMVSAFAQFGVTPQQIATRCQCHIDAIRPAQVVQLSKIFASLKDGMSAPGDWFEGAPSAASVVAAADAKAGNGTPDRDTRIGRGVPPDPGTVVASGRPPPDQPRDEPQGQQQPSAEAVTAFFPTDDTGEPAEIPGNANGAFSNPGDFAGWLGASLRLTSRPAALWENNLDAIEDLKRLRPDLAEMAYEVYVAAVKRVEAPHQPAPDTQAVRSEQAPDAPQDGAGEADPIPLVQVPRTPGGKESWPLYATACRKGLNGLATQAEVTAWVNRNHQTYQGKVIDAAIDRHVRETRQRIDAAERPNPQDVYQRPAQLAIDHDANTCADYLEEIRVITSLDAGRSFLVRGDVVAKKDRWEREKPELWQRVEAAAAAKTAELKGTRP